MEEFVARQPIFRADLSVAGYELLARTGPENAFLHAGDGAGVTRSLVANAFTLFGLDVLSGGRKVFINATRDFLLGRHALDLPADRVAIEVLEDVVPDAEVQAACADLKAAGFTLALDDFTAKDLANPLLDQADIVKVDVLAMTPAELSRVCAVLRGRPLELLAEKVEDNAAFERSRAEGCTYFQGFFFARPAVLRRKPAHGLMAAHLHLVQLLAGPIVGNAELETAIKQEPSVALRLLRCVNSAHFAMRHEIRSIRHALILLGDEEARRWLWLVLLADMGRERPDEVVVTAAVRARFCELLASASGDLAGRADKAFLVGLLSLADAILDCRPEDVFGDHLIDDEVQVALNGEPSSPFGALLAAVRAYERGDWAPVLAFVEAHGIARDTVLRLYLLAARWAQPGQAMTAAA